MSINPITFARVSAGVSKTDFPKKLDVSRTYTIRAEQGCYTNPNPKLVDFSCGVLNISSEDFHKQYVEFQNEQRLNSVESKDLRAIRFLIPNPPVGLRYVMHEEFYKWRLEYFNSRINFCAALCLHPTSVENYEEGKYRKMPSQIRDVLNRLKLMGDLNPSRVWIEV